MHRNINIQCLISKNTGKVHSPPTFPREGPSGFDIELRRSNHPVPHLDHHLLLQFYTIVKTKPDLIPSMWDDQPVQRQAPPVDMPPSTRAFLSQFNRSFTPPALINDPYAVDKKLVITPLLFGPRPLHVSRNPFAVDPAVERLRHYVGCEDLTDPDLRPSPVLQAAQNDDWFPEDDETFTTEGIDGSVFCNSVAANLDSRQWKLCETCEIFEGQWIY